MYCHICNELLISRGFSHIYKCDKISSNRTEVKFKFIQHNFKEAIYNKDIIEQKYITEQLSIKDLSNFIGLIPNHTRFLLDYYNITQRTLKEAINTENIKDKRTQTIIDRYGVENASKSVDVKEKKRQTFLKNYGVGNIFQSDEFKAAVPNTMLQKYGKRSLPNRYGNMQRYWDSKSIEEKRTHMLAANNGYKRYLDSLSDEEKEIIAKRYYKNTVIGKSRLEDRFANILLDNNIEFIRQKWIGRKSFDFYIPNTNIVIEINGNFWHANPMLYSENDLMCVFNNGDQLYAVDLWNKDAEKNKIAVNHGYVVYYIWETEFKESDEHLMKLFTDIIRNHTIPDTNQSHKL